MSLLRRVFGIIKIDNSVFREIDKDKSAIPQGLIVAFLTAIANALIAKKYFFSAGGLDVALLILVFMWLFLNWYVLCIIINFLGFKVFSEGKETNKFKNLLRLIGYSYSPELIKFLLLLSPQLIQAVSFGTFIWVIACQVLATKMTFNFKSFWKTLGIVILSYIIQIILVAIIILLIYSFLI